MPRIGAWGWLVAACPAQPAHAADRFAREIARILTGLVVRLRRLMGNPLGGWGSPVG